MSLIITNRLREKIEITELPKYKKVIKNILKISVPAALETLLIGIIGLIDTIMVGGISVEALAAVSICQQPVFVSLAASFGINAGITAIIARRRGENDSEGAKNTLRQSIILCSIAGLVLSILSIVFARPFLLFAKAEADTIDYAVQYFSIVSSVLVFNYIRLAICAALRAEGDTKVTLITNIVANLINVFLNYCLIGGNFGFPRLGVVGAAIATAIGNFVAFLIAIFIIRFKKSFIKINRGDNWRLDKVTSGNIIHVSLPAFIEQLFMRLGFFLIALIVNGLGTKVVAMNAIIAGIISLAFNITDGFSIGCSSLVGSSLGAGNKVLAFVYARFSQIISFVLGLIMITLIFTFRIPVSRLFSEDMDVINGASEVLYFAVFVIFPQSLQWITTGALRGAGDVKFTAKTSMISVAIIRPLFAYCLCYTFGLGLLGSWIGMFIDQTIRFVVNNYRLTHFKWMDIRV